MASADPQTPQASVAVKYAAAKGAGLPRSGDRAGYAGAEGADQPGGDCRQHQPDHLTWTASTDDVRVTGYLVERCQGAGCTTFAQIDTATEARGSMELLRRRRPAQAATRSGDRHRADRRHMGADHSRPKHPLA
jgi:hypothetical protein